MEAFTIDRVQWHLLRAICSLPIHVGDALRRVMEFSIPARTANSALKTLRFYALLICQMVLVAPDRQKPSLLITLAS
jgi:hypothetical protein